MEGKGVPFVGRMLSWRKQSSRMDLISSTAESLDTGIKGAWYYFAALKTLLRTVCICGQQICSLTCIVLRAGLGQLPLSSRPMFAFMFGAWAARGPCDDHRAEESVEGNACNFEQKSGQTL